MLDLFHAIWLVDFEFHQPPGAVPEPICMVAKEFRSGRTVRIFQDELTQLRAPPFPVGPETIYIAYFASAEIPAGRGLLGALTWFGLDALSAAEKDSMRDLASRGGPWTAEERAALLDYCESDVAALARLLPAMLPHIDLPRALLRGRYMVAVAKIERTGVPIDVETYDKFKDNWNRVLEIVIRELDVYGLYECGTFRLWRFREWLVGADRAWPYLDSGSLALDGAMFEMMADLDAAVEPVARLRAMLSELRLSDGLTLGPDGRNRCLLSPFASRTSRNQPSNAKFIFGPAAWTRGLIQPEPGRAVAYVDWSQQEFGIAAALSGDSAMMAAYASGDPYLAFGKQAGRIPPNGTRQTHETERDRFKECCLGVQYGMGLDSLAKQIKQQPAHARELLELYRRTYPRYWEWSDQAEVDGMLGGSIQTVFGWPLRTSPGANPRSIRNFPCQANGAEMLRLACCLATEWGIAVAAPVHDALLVEGPLAEIEEVVAATQLAMREASEIVLDGFALRSKAQTVKHPERLLDDKTRPMWDRVTGILEVCKTDHPASSMSFLEFNE